MTTTAIKERPILFSGEMVKAIIAGRKTQTRRVLSDKFLGSLTPADASREAVLAKCPYGLPGDRLWVREAFSLGSLSDDGRDTIAYRADGAIHDTDNETVYEKAPFTIDDLERDQPTVKWAKWRPSIHMPRWASRITLEIEDVRVERLQAISEQDAIAEGIRSDTIPACGDHPELLCYVAEPDDNHAYPTAREALAKSWDHINGRRGYPWASNPWVWAITFKVVEGEK